jgi:hypothetical protein
MADSRVTAKAFDGRQADCNPPRAFQRSAMRLWLQLFVNAFIFGVVLLMLFARTQVLFSLLEDIGVVAAGPTARGHMSALYHGVCTVLIAPRITTRIGEEATITAVRIFRAHLSISTTLPHLGVCALR